MATPADTCPICGQPLARRWYTPWLVVGQVLGIVGMTIMFLAAWGVQLTQLDEAVLHTIGYNIGHSLGGATATLCLSWFFWLLLAAVIGATVLLRRSHQTHLH